MSVLGTVIGGGLALGSSIGGTVVNAMQQKYNRDFAREENALNREHQITMSKNNIKYAVDQAKELGISPSLVLGHGTTSLGGSNTAPGGGSHVSDTSGINAVVNAINENSRLKSLEEMNEDKIDAMKEIQLMRMKNSTTNNDFIKNNYTREQIDKIPINDFNNW